MRAILKGGRFCRPIAVLVLAWAAAAAPSSGAAGPPRAVLSIYPGMALQAMAGFGAGFNGDQYFAKIARPEDRERAYDLLYGPQENGTRLSIVRLVVSDKAQETAPNSPLRADGVLYDWGGDPGTQAVWRAIRPVLARIRPVIYAVPFSPPARWKDSQSLNKGGRLRPDRYRDYAEYLADFLDYYRRTLKTEIDVLSLQNEPGIAAAWDSCLWTGEELRDFLKILAPAVRARGLGPKLMLSEGTAWSGAWAHLEPALLDPEARPLIGVLASHSYGPAQDAARARFAAASETYKLPVWMSEMSLMQPPELDDRTMKAALRVADYVHRDIAAGRASAWIYCFGIFTYQFKGSMGLLSPADAPGEEGRFAVPKRFWALAQYSQFVRPGWKAVKVEATLNGAPLPDTRTNGFVSPDGEGFVVVSVNPTAAPVDAAYDFGPWTLGPEVESFVTSADRDLAAGVVAAARAAHAFAASLPPESVTTFRGRLAKESPGRGAR